MAANMEAVMNDLCCDICMEIFVEPKMLPCQHTFCFNCIQTLYANENRLRCPVCRFEVRTIDALPPNIYIDRLVSHVLNGSQDDVGVSENDERSLEVDVATEQTETSRLIDNETTEEREAHVCCESACQAYRSAVAKVWLFLQELFIDMGGIYWKRLLAILFILCFFNIGRIVAGAVKIQSSCSLERHIGIFLFLKAMLAFFSWGCMVFFCLIKIPEQAARNSFVIIYYTLDMLFAFCWLCYGTYLTFGGAEWDSCTQVNFYQFSRFLVSFDWIGCAAFVFYLLYRLCSDQRHDAYVH